METQRVSHYELRSVLGESGRGTVYKAWDLKLDRWVALTLFQVSPDQKAEAEFRRSVAILSSWKHPHIACVYDFGESDGQLFLATEYMPGGTLKAQIDASNSVGGRFSFEDIVEYAIEVADGLVHVHELGVRHGKLKAESVMVGESGVLKICDFDFAEESPDADAERFDLYSFGLLLFQLATGQTPIQGLHEETLSAAPEVSIHSLARLRDDLPESFTRIIVRLLAGSRTQGYAHMVDVLSDLRTFREPRVSKGGVAQPQQTVDDASRKHIARHRSMLSENQLLAERFRIIRFLGRGGMGEVYAAEDLELREEVALKTVRPEIALDQRAIDRFRQEIQLARKVTHPNVCRIYDLFHHSPKGSGDPERITFLTMELLQGETLAERVRRAGPMHTSEALPLVTQMAAALDAAHKAGIVHGDFKSPNVMLAGSDGGPRVVVTDFGLARHSVSNAAFTETLGKSGDIVGTPAYMAPEQIEGAKATPAADIYALGVVIYEIVTGTLPFTGESPLSTALNRLKHNAPSPRIHVPDLDPGWERTILRCLERDPADRLTNAADVPAALTGEMPAAATPRRRDRAMPLKRALGDLVRPSVVIALILALGLVIAAVYQSRLVRPNDSSRRSVAVLGFTNLTGRADAAWLSTALSEMLTTELAAGEQLRTIPGETVARMKVELSLADSVGFAPDTLSKIRDYLDADLVVFGGYVMLGDITDRIRLDLRLQDTSNGEILTTLTDTGSSGETLDLVSRAGVQLREKLSIRPLAPADLNGIRAAVPSSAEATRFYAEGLVKLRVFDALGARSLLEKAVAEDPKHALARSALATSWSMLGFTRRAKEEAEVALEMSTNLPREEKLLVEGRYREAMLDWKGASEAYETLFGFFPDNLDYGLRFASAQISAGNAKDAANTVEKLRKLSSSENENPRINLLEARLAGALSDFRTQQTLAAAVVAKGKSMGARLLVAGGRLIEGSAFASLGNVQQAGAAFEEARGMYVAAGDRWDAANASTNLALVLAQAGDLDRAKATFEDSLMTYHELGDQRGAAAVLVNLGTVLRSQADFTGARLAHDQALAIYRETGDRSGEAKSLNNLANLLALEGKLLEAEKLFEEALPIFREGGDLNATATVLANLAELLADQGKLAEATRNYEEALAIARDVDNKSSTAYIVGRMADLLLAKGDLAGARAKYEEALRIKKQVGENGSDTELALANLLLLENSPREAEQSARLAAEQFRKEGRTGDEASALAVVARALFAEGKRQELPQIVDRAIQLSEKSGNRSVRLSVGIFSASIIGALGDQPQAARELNRIIGECQKAGLVGLELQARLALAEVDLTTGRRTQALARLRALEDVARSHGSLFIAQKAAEARSRNTKAS